MVGCSYHAGGEAGLGRWTEGLGPEVDKASFRKGSQVRIEHTTSVASSISRQSKEVDAKVLRFDFVDLYFFWVLWDLGILALLKGVFVPI